MANRFLSNLRINDAYTFPASDGTSGQVIGTDGAGNLSFINIESEAGSTVIYKDNFSGDNSTVTFTLAHVVSDEVVTQVYMDGVYQNKDTYIVSGDQITFDSAPPTGVEIEVISFNTVSTQGIIAYNAKNSTGSTIAAGTAVMAVGTDGNSGHILIAPMVADGSVEPKYFIGVTADEVLNGEYVDVVHFGVIGKINTSAFSDGDILWLDPANNGGFTTTEPNAPNIKIAAAIVLNSGTNGKIFVRVQGNEGLHELHDVHIENLANQDILVYNTTQGYWENSKTLGDITTGNIIANGTVDVNSDSFQLTGSTNPTVLITDTTNNVSVGLQALDASTKIDSTHSFKIEIGQSIIQSVTSSGIEINGNITTSGTVDGVDVSAFKTDYDSHTHTESEITDFGNYLTNVTHDTVNTKLVVTKRDGTTTDLSLSQYIDDTNLAYIQSGTLDGATGIATFTRDDATSFTVDLSALLDDTDTNDFLTGASFNTADGVLTLTVQNQSDVTVDLDGRYLIEEVNTFLGDGGDASTHPGTSRLIFSGQVSNDASVLGMPAVNNANAFININKHPGEYNSQLGFSSNGNIYYRNFNNAAIDGTTTWRTIWDSGNDGAGSGLDADMLDGNQATDFALAGHTHGRLYAESGITTNYLALSSTNELELFDSSGVVQDLYLNHSGGATSLKGPAGSTVWTSGNDGSGSGLDADTVDGYHVGNSTNNIAYLGSTRNLVINNPEAYTGEVRLGAAWDYGGVYASSTLTMASSSDINFVINNAVYANLTTDYFRHNGKILMGTFPQSTVNSGDAWIGRAADRAVGTMTVQLGTAADRNFEVVDHAWSIVTFAVNGSGIASAYDSFRAPIFYDSNNTGYYTDPSGSSILDGLRLKGLNNNASGSDYMLWVDKTNNFDWGVAITGGLEYHYKWEGGSTHIHGITGYKAGSEYFRVGTDLAYHDSSFRAPIFYDSDNTGYYLNPADNSYVHGIVIASDTPLIFYGAGGDTYTQSAIYCNSTNWVLEAPLKSNSGSGVHVPMYFTWRGGYSSQGGLKIDDGYTEITGATYSPIFYDTQDTNYYSDPNGLTRAKAINVGTNVLTGNTTYPLGVSNAQRYQIGFQNSSSSEPGYYPWLAHDDWNGSAAILHFNGIGDKFRFSRLGIGQADNDWRAPLFYDSNDTNYYMDPNGTSVIRDITISGKLQNNPGEGYWRAQNTYTYIAPTVYYPWIKVANLASGTSIGAFEYYAKRDSNYPGAVRGTVHLATYASSSMSVQHDTESGDGQITAQVFIDNNRDIWMRFSGSAWNSFFRWRWLYNSGITEYDGSGQTTSQPANSAEVARGESKRFDWNNAGSVTHDYASFFTHKNISAWGRLDTPVMYDSDNSARYVDPSSQSNMGKILFLETVNQGTPVGEALIGRNYAYNTLELKGYGAEMMIGSQSQDLHINYRYCNGVGNNTYTPQNWYWRAGTSSSLSNHHFGYAYAWTFYDESNTSYLLNPDGTSYLLGLTVNGAIDNYGGINAYGGIFAVPNMTIDKTSTYGTGIDLTFSGSQSTGMLIRNNTGTTTSAINFFYSSAPQGARGSITVSSTSTAYNTSSDYRLKENVVPMTGSLERVDQLNPSRFNFIGDDKTVDGFLAHEAAEVVPEAVTGTKDEVDEEGNPVYQGIDQAKLVPLLVGAIQELKAEVEALKQQLNGTN